MVIADTFVSLRGFWFVVIGVLWLNRSHLTVEMTSAARPAAAARAGAPRDGSFAFLAIPAVWVCFGFFFLYAVVISGIQAFAPEAAPKIGGVLPVIAKSILPAVAASICGGPEVNVENASL